LTLVKSTVLNAPTTVLFSGAEDTFYAANVRATSPVGHLHLQENTELQLKNPQNQYGVYDLINDSTDINDGRLLLNGTPNLQGLTVRTPYASMSQNTGVVLGLMPDVLPKNGTKLLWFSTPAMAIKEDYQKHISIVASVIKDNKDQMPDGTRRGHGYVFLTTMGSVRVYPAPHNGAPGADPMRYTDYITLYDALADMEKYAAPKDEKYTVNFIRDYTIGCHNAFGVAVNAEGAGVTNDLKKFKEFAGAKGTKKIKAISFSSIDQYRPELLTENDMKKLNTVQVQANAAYDNALQLPEKAVLALHGADPNADNGIRFESFLFGSTCVTKIAANGCTVTMGARGAGNNMPGSVRMTNSDLKLYGGTVGSNPTAAASARLVIHSGTYAGVYAGSENLPQQVTANATIDMNGGECKTVSGVHTGGVATVNFNSTVTVDTVTEFDDVNLNKNLTVMQTLDYGADKAKYVGNLTLADNAVLDFRNGVATAKFKAGKLTAGTNAMLFVPKDVNGVSIPLQVADAYAQTGSGSLITDVKDSGNRVQGDDLIVFATAKPAASAFFSTSMVIVSKATTPTYTIEYDLPNNPATRLALVGMTAAEKGTPSTKTLYFDSMFYDKENPNNDSAYAVNKLFVLTKEQQDAFILAKDQSSAAAMTTGKYTAQTQTFQKATNIKPDGIGDGTHTHYYSSVETAIDPAKVYYALTYAQPDGTGKEGWALAVLDVYAPNASAAGKTPKAVRGDGTGDAKKRTLNIPLAEISMGAHAPSGISRIAWSKSVQFGGLGGDTVIAPDIAANYPQNAFALPPKIGAWTAGSGDTGLQDITVLTPADNQAMYQMTVTTAQAKAMPTFPLYVQDILGNTREVTITPDWQFAADVLYLPGDGASGVQVMDPNVEINSLVAALPCPKDFAKTGFAFAGWKVTKDASGLVLGNTYFPTQKFKVMQDVELTAQWLPDDNKDDVPDAWQKKITFKIATADTAHADFANGTKSETRTLPQRKPDGTYTNGFDPSVPLAEQCIIIAASDVPVPMPIITHAFTKWTIDDADTAAVIPTGEKFINDKTEKFYYAHFVSNVTAKPLLRHSDVTQNTLPADAAPNKTLAFEFALQAAAGSTDLGNTQIIRAFITTDANWTYSTTLPTDAVEITLGGGAANTEFGNMSGLVTADIADTAPWYAYAVTNGGQIAEIVMDTTGSTYTNVSNNATGGVIQQKDMDAQHVEIVGQKIITSNIQANLTLADPIKPSVAGTNYIASGLAKAGWTATPLTAEQRTTLCTADGFAALSNAKQIQLFADAASAVHAADVPSDKLYLYTSDVLGNLRETLVPLTAVYNVSVPTWVGMIAIKGNADSKLITPTEGCYIVNNGTMQVHAAVSGFAVQGNANTIALVSTLPAAATEMQLKLIEKTSALGFAETPVASINSSTPLNLGWLPAYNASAPHGVGFTFTAKYLPAIPLKDTDWNLFTMSYQFTAATS
ncbi:MAG: hypothetical protein RR415_10950, partial [Ruthenibacterium sp.]